MEKPKLKKKVTTGPLFRVKLADSSNQPGFTSSPYPTPNYSNNAIISTFQISNTKRKRALIACEKCRKAHKRCSLADNFENQSKCTRCEKLKFDCVWRDPNYSDDSIQGRQLLANAQQNLNKRQVISTTDQPQSKKLKTVLFQDELIYANAINSNIDSQFITSTQALAPILSRDSFLCLEGESLGLYYPWRDLYNSGRDIYDNNSDIDPELKVYLQSKGAFELPTFPEQRKLVQMYLDNIYALYPVVKRDIIDHLEEVPLMLLNAMMLVGIRYDDSLKGTKIRIQAEDFYSKCKYLRLVETNKITQIQSYLLMSVHEEGPQGCNKARENVSKAGMLCVELGMHNFGASNQFDILKSAEEMKETPFKLAYNKGLLARLFWTSFLADRLQVYTSSSGPTFYHEADLYIDEPQLEDFDDNEHRPQDFLIFKRWFSLCQLFERVLVFGYRPPKTTKNDPTIEVDMIQWEIFNLVADIPPRFLKFFKISYGYCNIMYLRCKVDFFTLLSNDNYSYIPSSMPLSANKMFYLNKFSSMIIENSKSTISPTIESIVTIHAIVHVMVLLHLEIKSRLSLTGGNIKSSNDKSINIKLSRLSECLEVLEKFKFKWWYSAASYYLFKALLDKNHITATSTNPTTSSGESMAAAAASSPLAVAAATIPVKFDESSAINELVGIGAFANTQELLSSVFQEGKLFLELNNDNNEE